MEKIVNLAKTHGFIFQGSEIYGGLSSTFDYGPLGVLLKNNIKEAFIKKFVQEQNNVVLIDSAILMNSKVWEASGHLDTFTDPLLDCKKCKNRFRADKLVEEFDNSIVSGGWSNEMLEKYISDNSIKCPTCGATDYTNIRKFNLMFKTFQGVTEDNQSVLYLRPETAQGIFVNFKNIERSTRKKIPFGIAQIGKSFRNEITPGNFIFRTREFEQMELQFFCKPGTELVWHDYYKKFCFSWLESLGVNKENLRLRDHEVDELSHYSNATTDFEYKYPFGWGELWGIASRTDYDLTQHQKFSKSNMEYFDQEENKKYIPYVIEPSVGVDRLLLTFLCDAYVSEKLEDGSSREVLKLHPTLAPMKAAVLPLVKKFHSGKAIEIYSDLSKHFMIDYDDSGNIGRRYRRQDVTGTPFCITIDDDSINNDTVTIRYRDSMEQIVIKLSELTDWLKVETCF